MKDFAKSIRTQNKAIYDDKGQFIIGYVEKEGSEYVAYTHGITGSKSFLLKASDEKTAIDELKDYAKSYWGKQGNKKVGNEDNSDIIRAAKKLLEDAKKFGWAELGYNGWTKKDVEHLEKRIKELEQKQRTGNAKACNKTIVLKDGDVWVVLYANETKSQEFETEEEAREFAKKVGNSNVGNSVPDNLHERFGYRLAVTKDGEGKKQTISELEMSISDYKNEIAEKEKELNKDKQNLQKLEAVLRKYK